MEQCPLCVDFTTPTFQLLIQHIGQVHSKSSDFHLTCGVNDCQTTFTNFAAFKRHLRKKHRSNFGEPSLTASEVQTHNGDFLDEGDVPFGDSSEEEYQPDSVEERMKTGARWILRVKEGRKLTQSCLDELLSDVTDLCSYTAVQLGQQASSLLRDAGIKMDDIPGLNELFQEGSPYCQPFSQLETQHRQLSFYRSHFNYVDPVQVVLGTHHEWKGNGTNRKIVHVKDSFTYVPILMVLEAMFKNQVILEEVLHGHMRTDSDMADFCDSPKSKEHPLFGTDAKALQLLLYFDDLELCNPIGAFRKKHKLGCFYYTLGNVSPKFRSSLKSIQLLALVEKPVYDMYGMDKVLEPAVDDIKKLEQGVTLQTCEGPMKFRGTLATGSADNLGSHAICGFKEGSTAFRGCRQCMCVKDEMKDHFHEQYYALRTPADHQRHCENLKHPSLSDHYSVTYGVNRDSILNSLSYFHVCDETMPPDLMHDVLEGYLPYTLKLMLRQFIEEEGYFRLSELNTIISNFSYGIVETTSTPSPISQLTLRSTDSCGRTQLSQTASQTWTLGRLLPVMIGHLVPHEDPYWLHFLQLLDMMELMFAPVVKPETPAYLQVLVEENLTEFTELYPSHPIIPKLHYLIHVPRYMERLGPLVRHWTMRFEAKHQYFKQLASRMGNFINITWSLAVRHQCYQCYVLSSELGFCDDQQEIGKGSSISLEETQFKDNLGPHLSGIKIFRTNFIRSGGMKVKEGAVIITDIDHMGTPTFGEVKEIFSTNGEVLLGIMLMKVIEYSHHHHSWIVEHGPELNVINLKSLDHIQILEPRPVRGYYLRYFLTLKYAV